MIRSLPIAIAILSLLTSCVGSATPARAPSPPPPTPTLEPGWVRYVRPPGGFVISLPQEWRAYDMTPELVDQLVPSVQEAGFNPTGLYELMRDDLVASCKFAAFDVEPDDAPGDFSARLVLTRHTRKYALTLDELVQETFDMIQALPRVISGPDYRRVDLAVGQAAEVHYTAEAPGDGGAQAWTLFIYLIARGQDTYAMTFRAAPTEAAQRGPEFEQIAETFHWAP